MKLILVDDEPIVLQGLERILSEHANAFHVTATCGSGEEALEAVRQTQPDIVITDIRMGGMSGLELAEQIKALDEQIVVILLTGYSDFAFAQKALSLDVFEYLVKPTRHEDILSCLTRAKNKRKRLLEMGSMHAPEQNPQEDDLSALVSRVLSGSVLPNALSSAEQSLSPHWRSYFLMKAQLEPDGPTARDTFSLDQSLRNLICGAFPKDVRLTFVPDDSTALIVVVFSNEAGSIAAEQIARCAGDCVRSVHHLLDMQLVIGLSGAKTALSDLPVAHAEATSARSQAAKNGHNFSSFSQRSKAAYSPSIKKALNYIHAHYIDGVSLKDVSTHVFLNAWYFSELFKKEIGKSFTDYILEIRIQHAKALIADKHLPLYQISYMVGINSPTYFSQVFKKATGFTPKEYRKRL